jgi:hypothetical protein
MRIFGFDIKISRKHKLSYVGEICKVKVCDGDVMVIIPKRPMSEAHVSVIADVWERNIGDRATLLFLDDGAKIAVLSPDSSRIKAQTDEDEKTLRDISSKIKGDIE